MSEINEAKEILFNVYDKYNRKSINFGNLIGYLQKESVYKTNEKTNVLGKKNTALYTKLRMLNQMNILHTEKVIIRNKKGRFVEKYNKYMFNEKIIEWKLPNF